VAMAATESREIRFINRYLHPRSPIIKATIVRTIALTMIALG
jgi:hypothetical protein